MAELCYEDRHKEKIKTIKEFLKYMIDNPDHEVKLLQMWSRHEAQIVCKGTCFEKFMDYTLEEDGQTPHAYLDFHDIIEALNLKEP